MCFGVVVTLIGIVSIGSYKRSRFMCFKTKRAALPAEGSVGVEDVLSESCAGAWCRFELHHCDCGDE